jgi:hypothetical protein
MYGYPFTPLVFAGVTVWFLVTNITGNPVPSLSGMAILAAGIPVYLIWGKRPQVSPAETSVKAAANIAIPRRT